MKSALKQHITQTFANYRWLLHLIFWIIFIVFCFSTVGRKNLFNNPHLPSPFPLLAVIAFLGAQFLQSYTIVLGVMPLYSKNRKYIFWPALVFTFIAFYTGLVLIIKLIAKQVPIVNARLDFQVPALFREYLVLYMVFSGIFLAFYYFIDIYDQQKKIQRLEHYKTRKIALESSFLKSQINPHFLFNTLNNIYALSLKKSTQTPVIIERLESLLHYMLFECKADLVPLENEFTFTNSYIALEKLRHKEDQCTVTINIDGDPSPHKIAPLLLINFLENAFKHGTKTSFGQSWIRMDILITKKQLHFKLKNSKPKHVVSHGMPEYRGGIGLKNVKRRLEILYPRQHQLKINDTPADFEVDLTINF